MRAALGNGIGFREPRILWTPDQLPSCIGWWAPGARPGTITVVDCVREWTTPYHASYVGGKVIEDTSLGIHGWAWTPPNPTATVGPCELAFLAKAAERINLFLSFGGASDTIVYVDTGTVTELGVDVECTAVSAGDGWYQIVYRSTKYAISGAVPNILLMNETYSYQGDGVSGAYTTGMDTILQQRVSALSDQVGTAHFLQATPALQPFWCEPDGIYDDHLLAPFQLWQHDSTEKYATNTDAATMALLSAVTPWSIGMWVGPMAATLAADSAILRLPSLPLQSPPNDLPTMAVGLSTDRKPKVWNSDGASVTGGEAITTGTGQDVVVTYDGTSIRIYQHGVLTAGPTAWAPSAAVPAEVRLSAAQCAIGEVSVLATALSERYVRQLTDGIRCRESV